MALVGSLSGSFGLVGISGTMEPAVNNAYSLGTSSNKWSTVFATALTGSHTTLADGRSFLVGGSNVTITSASDGQITIASTGGGGGSGDNAAQYLVLAATASLDNERVFTAGTGISVTDAGAGGNFTVGINNSVVATLTGSAFSGPIAGTTLSMTGNITGSNFLVSGDEITATAPVRINLGNTAATVNIGQSGTGNALNVKGNLDVDGTADIAGTVTLSGNGQNVTHSGTGNLTIASTSGNVLVEGTVFSGNDVTVPGNLTVNGTVVSIATDNLKIKDSVVLVGSGSTSLNSKAAIAFVSGSSLATSASLVFGSIGGGDTLAAGRMDVQDGGISGAALSFLDLVPLRASRFEVGGATAYITSSLGNNLNIVASAPISLQSSGNKIFLQPGSVNGSVEFQYAGVGLAEFTGSAGNAVFGAITGKTMAISGSQVFLNAGGPGIRFQRDGGLLGTVQGQAGTSMSLTSVDVNGASRSLILSGSSMILGSNTAGSNAITFRVGDSTTTYAQFGSNGTDAQFGAVGRRLILSGTQLRLNGQTGAGGGFEFQADGNTFLTILSGAGPGSINIAPAAGMTQAQLLNTDVTTVNFAGAATVLNLGATSGTTTVRNALVISGSTTLGEATSDDITFTGRAASSLLPKTDSAFDLGSPSFRWANIYTGDLHLRNDRGNWTIIEESEYLTITNNLNGKRYKFVLEEL